ITRLCYIPNAGHDLRGGEEAMQSLGGFFETLMAKAEIPACSWKTKVMGHRLKVEVSLTGDLLRAIEVWEATSLTRDFRKSTWKGQPLDLPQKHQSTYNVSFELPASGYAAQYVALTYASPDGSLYTFTTRIFVTDSKRLW
ncbi:MAG: PhoPQ-activated protein PqaA family protein, partial [Alistipes sp.]|nr:PhoPQ-activated protein PqaA family protein [Alistipes sp.]